MTWLFLTIVSALFNALSRLLQRVLMKNDQQDPLAFSIIFQVIVAMLFFLYSQARGSFEIPNLLSVWPNLLSMMILYAIGNVLTFKAFQQTEASEVAVLFASSTIWSVIAALILLGETISRNQLGGIGLIVIGVSIISFRRTKWQLHRGHILALLAAFCYGIAFINDLAIMRLYRDVSSYMVVAFTLPALLVIAMRPAAIKAVPAFLTRSIFPKLLLCTTLYALAALTIFTAYTLGGSGAIIAAINQTNTIFTVGLGFWLLKERDRIPQKIWGTLTTFVGVLLTL